MGSSISRFTTGVSRIRTGSGNEVQELPLAPIMLDFLNLPGSPKQNPVKRTGFTSTIVTFGLNADIIATQATIHDCPNRQGSRLFCSLPHRPPVTIAPNRQGSRLFCSLPHRPRFTTAKILFPSATVAPRFARKEPGSVFAESSLQWSFCRKQPPGTRQCFCRIGHFHLVFAESSLLPERDSRVLR